MGASDSKSRPQNVDYDHAFVGTAQTSRHSFRPPQERQQQTSYVHSRGTTAVDRQPSATVSQYRPTVRQTQQTSIGRAPNQFVWQNDQRVSHPKTQQPLQQTPKPKKQTTAEVVQSLKEVLEGYDGKKFTLDGIDYLYRVKTGGNIPYAALGFTSLGSFIESRCTFLMIFTGIDGDTQVLLRPPSYQEATNEALPSAPGRSQLQGKNRLSELVHDQISQTDFNRLKHISETKARNGLTIQQFDDHHLAEFQTRIDFKGFSRAAFFRGLGDIVETREDKNGLKLYSKTRSQNAPQMSAKTTAQQNTGRKNQRSTDSKSPNDNGKKSQGANNSSNSAPKQQGQNSQQQTQKPGPMSAADSQGPGTKKLELAPYYEKELKKMIQECKSAEGVTMEQFKKHFEEHSEHVFNNFGYSDEEFFTALPHIFQIHRWNNAIRLKPAPLTSGFARNNFAQWQSTSALTCGRGRPPHGKMSSSAGNVAASSARCMPAHASSMCMVQAASSACTMHMLLGGRCLWIVSIGYYEYVPTGCVAKLANMARDSVINDLRRYNLEIRYIRSVDDPNVKAALVKNNVAQEDEDVMAIPLRSVPAILRTFAGKDVDDDFMANLEEVSKEHVRNKRFGRFNRQ